MEDNATEAATFEEIVESLPEKLRPLAVLARNIIPGCLLVESGSLTLESPGKPIEECDGFSFSQDGENVVKHGCASQIIVVLRGDSDLVLQVTLHGEPPQLFVQPGGVSMTNEMAALIRSAMVPKAKTLLS